jgi:RNA polymerase sigma factor (sigma-70 family)
MERQTAETLFLEHLSWINRIAAKSASRAGLSEEEASDFISSIRLMLMEDDYWIFRKHRGESTLKTYLATVVVRQLNDYMREKRGRWRPSTSARRLGRLAIRLEQLVYRDGFSVSQAVEALKTSEPNVPEERELILLLAQLPHREPLRPLEVAFDLSSVQAAGQADTELRESESEQQRLHLMQTVGKVIASLPVEDRVIVQLHFSQGLSLGEVARALGLEQKPLYRRVKRLREMLRQRLKDEGVDEQALPSDTDV